MNLDELQSVRDRERQTDKLQQLRESFYEDAGDLIQQLRRERERAAEQADDPFDSTTVTQLTDEIRTAEQMVEAIYEKRIGKIVKAASFDAAGLPAEADGMTAEEQDLFDNLVRDIQQNRERVLEVIGGRQAGDASAGADLGPPPVEQSNDSDGVPAAAAMGGETGDDAGEEDSPSETSPTPPPEREPPPDPGADESETDPASGSDPAPDERQDDRDGNGQPSSAEESNNESGVGPQPTDPETDETPGSDIDHESNPNEPGAPAADNDDEKPVREDGSGVSSGPGGTGGTGDPGDPDGTGGTAPAGAIADPATDEVQRKTVRILESVETFVGFDDRDYDLAADDVVTLPATNADLLLERGVARELD